jgi:hypothetical protein
MEAVKDDADVFGRFAKIGTVEHKEKRIIQLDGEEEMREEWERCNPRFESQTCHGERAVLARTNE